MSSPILKPGDLLKIKGYRNLRRYLGRFALNSEYCMVIDQKHTDEDRYGESYSHRQLLEWVKEVHRPQPDGTMKQVWPEVEGT